MLITVPLYGNSYSPLAEEFLLLSNQPDLSFPPEGWSDDNIRAAALEVLDIFETGLGEDWHVYYCLIALGRVKNPVDLDRILVYEETMPQTVIRAIHGFPDERAVECLLRWAKKDIPVREVAFHGLAAIDYNLLDEPEEWRTKVTSELRTVRNGEILDWLQEDIDGSLAKIDSSYQARQN